MDMCYNLRGEQYTMKQLNKGKNGKKMEVHVPIMLYMYGLF